jgi:addiction module RelE/StbE family toxin
MHKLRINPLAKRDLIDIKEYIKKELDNPTAAVKVVSRIIESYEKLKEFPMLGGDLSSKVDISTDYRYLISGNYIVFYKVDNIYVSIYRILYARRDYTKILFRDEKFEIEPK